VSDALNIEFDQALLNFQKECPSIPKNKSSKYHKYADLESVIMTVRPVLNKHGIVLQQATEKDGDDLLCYTILRYKGLVRESKGFPIPKNSGNPNMTPAQACGSDSTYQRRYDMCAFLGVVSEEDPDGGFASSRLNEEKSVKKVTSIKKNKPIEKTIEKVLNDDLAIGLEYCSKFKDKSKEKYWMEKMKKTVQEKNGSSLLSAQIESVKRQIENQ
tara:strand:- start:8971 stop:9615 length:645 start_codon:yes stop_codon:yes gene_type:complete